MASISPSLKLGISSVLKLFLLEILFAMWLYVEPLYVNRLSQSFPEWGWGCGVLSLSGLQDSLEKPRAPQSTSHLDDVR